MRPSSSRACQRLKIGALAAGQEVVIELDAVAVRRAALGSKPALDGVMSGTLRAKLGAPSKRGEGTTHAACPPGTPGAADP